MTDNLSTTAPKDEVLCTNFNQDGTSVSIGTKSALTIFSIDQAGLEIKSLLSDEEQPRIILAERLFSSSLLVVVSQGQPRRIRVVHFRKNTEICTFSYNSTILSIELNRSRLVVVLENSIHIHSIKDMKKLHTINETPANPRGVSCMSTTEHHPLLAYPGSTVNGAVHVFDTEKLMACAAIQAHRTPVVAVAIHDCLNNIRDLKEDPNDNSLSGCFYNVPNIRAILATASDTGTVVRLWAIKTVGNVEQLAELRRGVKRHAKVESMCFSEDGKWLALASDTITIHVWRLDRLSSNNTTQESNEDLSKTEYFKKDSLVSDSNITSTGKYLSSLVSWGVNSANSFAKQVLPTPIGDALSAERAFITATLPSTGLKPKVAILPNGLSSIRILACTKEGYLLIYDANNDLPGEANLIKQHKLTINENESDNEQVEDF